MCPLCMTTTLVWITAGIASTGGISGLLASKLRGKTDDIKARDMEHSTGNLPQNTMPIVSPWAAGSGPAEAPGERDR